MDNPLSDKKESARYKFDSFCKKALRCTGINLLKEITYLSEHEVNFSDLPPNAYPMSTKDDYFSQNQSFDTSIGSVVVKDFEIAEVISKLPDVKREIILLYYITEKTDEEIGEKLNMPRRTVQYQRTAAEKILRKIMEENWNEDK